MGENSLEALFPSLFRLSSLKSRPISEFYNHSSLTLGGNTSWNLHFSQGLRDREIEQLIELLQFLETKRMSTSVEDRRDWIVDSSGLFSCKSAFIWVRKDDSLPVNLHAKIIWKLNIPVKVKVFSWLLVLGKVSVHTNLQKRRPYQSLSPGWCVLCKKNDESIDHLFLHCEFSFRLWCKFLKEFGRLWVIPKSNKKLLCLGQGFFLNRKGKVLWKVASTAIIWAIWLEQNNQIFEEKEDFLEPI